MNSIICPECEITLRLSKEMVIRLQGRSGRIRCRACEHRVPIKGASGGIEVISEASMARARSIPPPFPGRQSIRSQPLEDDLAPLSSSAARMASSSPAAPQRSPSWVPPAPESTEEDSLSPVSVRLAGQEHAHPVTSIPPPPPRPWEHVAGREGQSQSSSIAFHDEFGIGGSGKIYDTVRQEANGRLVTMRAQPSQTASNSPRSRGVLYSVAAVAVVSLSLSIAQMLGFVSPQSLGLVQSVANQPSAPGLSEIATRISSQVAGIVSERSRASQLQTIFFPAPELVEAEPAQPKRPAASPTAVSVVAPKPGADVEEEAEEEQEDALPVFDSYAANIALKRATLEAYGCTGQQHPSGVARLTVVFAPSGKVTRATIAGRPFAGTPEGSCIATQFRQMRIPAFSGSHEVIAQVVEIH